MAWLPMYLLKEDLNLLNNWLNKEEEIAFLVSNGRKKWIAVKERKIEDDLGSLTMGLGSKIPNHIEYALWHTSSGPLPFITLHYGGVSLRLKKEDWERKTQIDDPWSGWTEETTGANANVPYFESHPGVIELTINVPGKNDKIPMSHFGWIGNHYSIIGSHADPSTLKFWNKLRRSIKKVATHIPRQNNSTYKKEIYAFPNAYQDIQNGRLCSLN